MHFHPFGIPLDELVFVVANAVQTPLVFYYASVKRLLKSAARRLAR